MSLNLGHSCFELSSDAAKRGPQTFERASSAWISSLAKCCRDKRGAKQFGNANQKELIDRLPPKKCKKNSKL